MAVKVCSLCLLTVALLGSLGQTQKYFQQKPQNSQQPPPPGQKPPSLPKTPQKPAVPQRPTCEVAQEFKIHCGTSIITESDCESINCCFDGQMCYYGNAVTLQCTKTGLFIVVIARDATLPNIDLGSIHFLSTDQECQPIDTTSAFAIYQFPATSCGTIMTETEASIITYENRISSSYEVAVGPYGAITRDSQFDLLVQCRYVGTSVEALVIEIGEMSHPPPVAAPGPLRVELRLGNGQCTAKGCMEADVAYTSYYLDNDYPVTKVLRDPVYVEVRMLERTDPNLVLTLGRCWTTSSPNPLSFPQWDLLVDGCPYRDDRYLTTLVPVEGSASLPFPSHYRRFIFKMFTFVASSSGDPTKKNPQEAIMTPLHEMVYIHCNTAACQRTPQDNCEPRCFRRRRDVAASVKSESTQKMTTVTSQAIVFVTPGNAMQ